MKIIKIGAVWCPGCLVMRPRWQKIEAKFPWLKTEYFDIDEHPELKEKYQLSDYPAFICLSEQGEVLSQQFGELSEAELEEWFIPFKEQ